MGRPEVRKHILEDVEYPTTKDTLVEACDNMSDVPEKDKEWFKETLPAGTYRSAGDILKILGL